MSETSQAIPAPKVFEVMNIEYLSIYLKGLYYIGVKLGLYLAPILNAVFMFHEVCLFSLMFVVVDESNRLLRNAQTQDAFGEACNDH